MDHIYDYEIQLFSYRKSNLIKSRIIAQREAFEKKKNRCSYEDC